MSSATQNSKYFDQRMATLGVTAETNRVMILQSSDKPGVNELKSVPVFRASEKGIDILVYSLDRTIINYKPENSRWSKHYCLTRLEHPIIKKDGSIQKYSLPKGQGTYPFFHPWLIELFEKKQRIDSLYLVEGYFKSWKGCMHGIPVVGLSSITHMKDKEKGTLHPDILRMMNACKVKRMVWLTDGDCLDITSKELKDGVDLYKRPKNFFSSCENFKTLLDDYDVDKWFFHIDSDNIISQRPAVTRDQVKGLDDLLCTLPDQAGEIVEDLMSVSRPGEYFVKHNITTGVNKVHKYFHLLSVNDFYLFHVERRPELKNFEFVFNGTKYKYDETLNECKIVAPREAKIYFRVGDTYYKFIEKINQYGHLEKGFEKRQKDTIKDDHGKDFIKHIPKYETFINYPDHTNYQQIIYNGFNVYSPFEHEPEQSECSDADCPNIMSFFQHIFGINEIKVKYPDIKSEITVPYYQLGLDYVQLLYQKPTVRLPILCLVSRENETGKSTFADFMKAIFTNNVAIVGNADLADDFNSFWATRLLIICDETKIDKQAVVEKVKSLTFAKKIGLNAKGKDKIEIDFFGKFMFLTNNEQNFIYASEEDLRYWVIKVPKIREKNPDFLQNMIDEIPYFLSYLNSRKIITPRIGRMWFDASLLKTEALKKVIQYSQPTIEKELRQQIRDMFFDFGVGEIRMTRKAIHQEFFKGKYEVNYLEEVLKERLKIDMHHVFEFEGECYKTEQEATEAIIRRHPDAKGKELEILHYLQKKYVVERHRYPKWYDKPGENKREMVFVNDTGRPYVFRRDQFLSAEEIESIKLDPEMEQFINSEPQPENKTNGQQMLVPHYTNGEGRGEAHYNGKDELPF